MAKTDITLPILITSFALLEGVAIWNCDVSKRASERNRETKQRATEIERE